MSPIAELIRDPVRVNAFLIILAFTAVFVLPGQSTAAAPTFLVALAMLWRVRSWRSVMVQPVAWLSAALLGYLALSCLWSQPNPDRDEFKIVSRALLTFFFVIAFAECCQEPLMERWFAKVLVVSGTLAVLAAGAVYVTTDPSDGRFNGLGQLGTHVIAALIFGVVLLYLLQIILQDDSPGWRRFAMVAAVFMVAAIILSGSRNAWVSVCAGVTVLFATHWMTSQRRLLVTLAAVGVLAAILLWFMLLNQESRELLMPRGDSYRLLIWSTIFERVWQHDIVFGMGVMTPDDVLDGANVLLHPHNMYLATLYQGGLVALGLFLCLLAVVVRVLYAHLEHEDAKLALGILGIAVPSYMLDGHELIDRIGETWFLFWIPVAIGLAFVWRSNPRGARAAQP